MMAFNGHHDLLKGGVACTFTYSVDSYLNLPGSVHYTGQSVCRSHAKIIVTVR